MRDLHEIRALLEELEHQPAHALEDQDLDFKEWNERSMADSVRLVIHMAVCMATRGGTVVFGVNDKALGRVRRFSVYRPKWTLTGSRRPFMTQLTPN